jgi:AbiV family abortive infection protein
VAVRKLPDLTPDQVVRLQDALLANSDALLTSALAVLDLGHAVLARSVAILGLEESGKAIAVHERRVSMGYAPDGEPFRCDRLDELWASHQKKLEKVHSFLVEEPYWFDVQPPDPDENAAYLGTIKAWARRHDRSKLRGFYVDLSKTGDVLAPTDVADEEALRAVIAHVHQIGWQLRLGEHIEGKRQDEKERGIPAMNPEATEWLTGDPEGDSPPYLRSIAHRLRESMKEGIPGEPLNNAAYRFNPPSADRSPFRNLGKPGYEAETRELLLMKEELDRTAQGEEVIFPEENEE